MANPSRVSTLVLSNATGSRSWTATAAVQDTAAGAAVTITLATGTAGTVFPSQETAYSLSVYVDATGTLVRQFSPGNGFNGTVSFSFTLDGVAGSAARAGLLRMVIAVQQTSGLAANQYNGSSDGGGTPATGYTFSQTDSGYVRGTTTATTTMNQASYAYGDTITATTTLGAAPFDSRTVNVAVGALSAVASATSTSAVFTTAEGSCDNRFPAASAVRATTTTFPNASLVAVPWTAATPTEASPTVDPRLTFAFLHQDNDNTFGTPPGVKDKGAQRLTSDLAFLDARVVNAAGAGVNGITWNAVLQDVGNLVAAVTRATTSSTQGGQAGWGSTFYSWPDQLPTGVWNKTNTITAPAAAVGLEAGRNTYAYSLVAANPNYRMLVGAGPATVATDSRHFTPGLPLLVGLTVFDTKQNVTLALDTSPAVPSVAIGRFNLTLGRAEYLQADRVTWAATNGATIYYFPLTVSAGDSNVWTASFTPTDTTGWSVADLFVVGKCTIGGVPVAAYMKEIVVSGINNHDAYRFDGAGFVGFPTGR